MRSLDRADSPEIIRKVGVLQVRIQHEPVTVLRPFVTPGVPERETSVS
jgi:hypothetical protein